MIIEVMEELSRRVLQVVDAGLVIGLGYPEPGKMCVGAAVNYALGMPHGVQNDCVAQCVRKFAIEVNDADWSSNEARAQGMRRLAIAQLGTAETLNDMKFVTRLAAKASEWAKSAAEAASVATRADTRADTYAAKSAAEYAERGATCATEAARYAASAIKSAAYAAASAAADAEYAMFIAATKASYAAIDSAAAARGTDATAFDAALADCCEDVVQILIDLGSPGCAFLNLTN